MQSRRQICILSFVDVLSTRKSSTLGGRSQLLAKEKKKKLTNVALKAEEPRLENQPMLRPIDQIQGSRL